MAMTGSSLRALSLAAWACGALGQAPLEQTVRVYPALRTGEEQEIFLARSRQIDLQLRQARQRGLGRDFESLREYREGDDLRDICWTATARRGSPITRQYQTERSQPVWIVLDCGRLMRSRVAAVATGTSGAACCSARCRAFTPSSTTPAPPPSLWRNWRFFPAIASACWPTAREHQQRLLPGRGAAHLRQIDRSARAGARRVERSRSSARHGHAESPAAAPVVDSVDHGSGRNRHAPRGDRRRDATAAPPCAVVRRHGAARSGADRPVPGPKMWSRCSAPPPRRRWPAAANCCWPACTNRARSPSTSTRKRSLRRC